MNRVRGKSTIHSRENVSLGLMKKLANNYSSRIKGQEMERKRLKAVESQYLLFRTIFL